MFLCISELQTPPMHNTYWLNGTTPMIKTMILESQGNFCAQSKWSLAGVGPRERAYGTSKYKWTIEGGGKANEENQGFNSSEDRRLGALNRTQGHQQLPLPVQKRHKWKSSRKEEIRKNKV